MPGEPGQPRGKGRVPEGRQRRDGGNGGRSAGRCLGASRACTHAATELQRPAEGACAGSHPWPGQDRLHRHYSDSLRKAPSLSAAVVEVCAEISPPVFQGRHAPTRHPAPLLHRPGPPMKRPAGAHAWTVGGRETQ